MRESERLRARLREIEQAVSGDRHAESYREFETAYETLYIEHEQAIDALERAEARVAELERERDDTYKDRNFAVMLAAEIARRSRTVQVSVWVDQDAPDWPVLALALPTGQVSWHIAPQDFMSVFPIGGEWDGHTTSEKHARIRRYILNEEATDDLAAFVAGVLAALAGVLGLCVARYRQEASR